MKETLVKARDHILTDLVIIGLALLSVGLLIFELSADLYPEHIQLLHQIDLVIALIFLGDFLVGLALSSDKKDYFSKNWYYFLASIPITEGVFRTLRFLRILRVIRIIRVATRIAKIGSVADKITKGSSKYVYVSTITTLVILSGAVSFFSAEKGINPNVLNFFDALWWAVVTVTTVGYGDIYPVTWEGRITGIILMFFGIGLVGTIAGLVGSYFLKKRD